MYLRPLVSRNKMTPRPAGSPRPSCGFQAFAGYSSRSACTGFTDAARRAGKKLAIKDAAASTSATQASVAGSQARTPNSRLRISIEVPMEASTPKTTPAPANHAACPITILVTADLWAPSAMRTPISRLRWATECDTTPYKPTAPRNKATTANTPTSHAVA